MYHWYLDHVSGALFSREDYVHPDYLYCDSCGDSDIYIGQFDTEKEAALAWFGKDSDEYKWYYEEGNE